MPIYIQVIVIKIDCPFKASMNGIVFKKMGEGFGIRQVVDGYNR